MERIVVKNFGAIREIDIVLTNLTLFIGETGTGKSIMAKLIAIFRKTDIWDINALSSEKKLALFMEQLRFYQLDNFLEAATYIYYQSNAGFYFKYDNAEKTTKIEHNTSHILAKYLSNAVADNEYPGLLSHNFTLSHSRLSNDPSAEKNGLAELFKRFFKEVLYMPAERVCVNLLAEKYPALARLDLTDLFPETLLDFTATFVRASSALKKIDISLFDVTYQKLNGKDYIMLPNGQHVLLSEAASGMQTTVPALIIFIYLNQSQTQKSYIFEEPELNLFPLAQKSLIEFLSEYVLANEHQLIITTHSPYIMLSINNLLFASKIIQEYPDKKDTIIKITGLNHFIAPSETTLYYLGDNASCSSNLLDEAVGMIPDNDLDSASNKVIDVFDQMMSAYREFKRTNN